MSQTVAFANATGSFAGLQTPDTYCHCANMALMLPGGRIVSSTDLNANLCMQFWMTVWLAGFHDPLY